MIYLYVKYVYIHIMHTKDNKGYHALRPSTLCTHNRTRARARGSCCIHTQTHARHIHNSENTGYRALRPRVSFLQREVFVYEISNSIVGDGLVVWPYIYV